MSGSFPLRKQKSFNNMFVNYKPDTNTNFAVQSYPKSLQTRVFLETLPDSGWVGSVG